jgi:predicted small lipoprotein YifL
MTLRTLAVAGAAAALAIGLTGCGKLGDLERPGPIFGGKSNADAGPEPTRTVRTVDPRDRNSDPAPSRTVPIDSTSNPSATGPQGALEDPYARPR